MDTSHRSTPTSAETPAGAGRWSVVTRRWPSLLGLAVATAVLATGADREVLSITVAVAALCYLAAAALGRPWVAWAVVGGGGIVVAASELAGVPWWAGVGVVAALLVIAGLVGGVPRAPLAAQAVALLGYGGLAVTAVLVAPRVGLVLAGLALAAHGIWDVVHYRRDEVVPRSLAEFCVLLDVPLGLGFLVLATVAGPQL
ncbi:hypothetical protein E1258_09315 [Micromonospora sp. KC207]|uniref:hypothetical protein n=1 Tax=Micromonospora sp. KC207 TaxID=2530377 RepID=UPI00104BC716|nr:hypothetical protein [Micromonospora sp. KC207]TDC64001.1 hypothetical protein E1258_09315 [Micromonospora sp. KC207]